MNSANFKILFVINILFFSKYSLATSNCEDSCALSGISSKEIEEDDKQDISEIQEMNSEYQGIKNSGNKIKLEKISAGLLILKGKSKSPLESYKKTKFDQIKDAIEHNAKSNRKWLKSEFRDFKNYINTQDENGNTLLHIATRQSTDGQSPDFKILHYLLYFLADPEIKNKLGLTPSDHIELLKKQLLDKFANKSETKAVKVWEKFVLDKNKKLQNIDPDNKMKELGNNFKQMFKNFKKTTISSSYDK